MPGNKEAKRPSVRWMRMKGLIRKEALQIMRRHPLGQQAAVIGDVTGASAGRVVMRTTIGGLRAIDMLAGEQLPRIC